MVKKFIALMILMCAPVFADQSTMHSFLGATSDATALSPYVYFGADAALTRGDYSPSGSNCDMGLSDYSFDFDASTNTLMPNSNFARIYEAGKSGTVTFVDAVYDNSYVTALYQKGNNGVLFTKDKNTGATVAVKELARSGPVSVGYDGMISISPGEYFAYGRSSTTFFGVLFTVSGSTYSVTAAKTINLGNGLNDNYAYDAVYDSYSDTITLCGISTDLEAPQYLACVILDAADLTPDDSADWTVPNPMLFGYTKVAAYITGTGDTQLAIADIGDGDVYYVSVDVASASDSFAASDNWQKKGNPLSGSFTALNDLLVDDLNNFVSILKLTDTHNYGLIGSLDDTDGSTEYAHISGQSIYFNDLCRVTSSRVGIAAYDTTLASACVYLIGSDGTVHNAKRTTAGGGGGGSLVTCADVIDPGTSSQLVGLGGNYDNAINQYESLYLFNVGSDAFVSAIYMTYEGLAGTKPDKNYKILFDGVDSMHYFSNQGIGGQDFGPNQGPSGVIPEFSLSTLLLAVLLTGGLFLFVIRRRP